MPGIVKGSGYAWAAVATAASTMAGYAMRPHFDLVNIAMVYLLAVVLVATRFPRGPVVVATILCVLAFDVLFVPPEGTFAVEDAQYLVTFAIMLAVGLIVSGLVESVRDQARAQAALELRAETERLRSTLLASISHDLRTPLAVMTGASSSLAESGERLGAGERQALARSVFERSREMSEHVDKVLQMTRLESGAIVLDRDWESLGEIAASVLRQLGERLSSHPVIVQLPDDLPLVRVDAGLIAQVFSNLLENAARHTPAGTAVRLAAQALEREVEVTVEDYGGGIAEADIERVFEKFHHGAMEGARGGMGLGLAICRAIVLLHGGRCWAERVPAGATAFRFTLPREKAPAAPVEEPGPPP